MRTQLFPTLGSILLLGLCSAVSLLPTVHQGTCVGDHVDSVNGIICAGSCDPTPPTCMAKDVLKAWQDPPELWYQYCGCDGVNEPSCCHVRAFPRASPPGWYPDKAGTCIPCPLTGQCQLNVGTGSVFCQ